MPKLDDDFRAPDLRDEDFLGAFGVVRRDGRILMVQNERVIDGRPVTTWDLPGGQVERGELLAETLGRELEEETGLAIRGATPFLFLQEGVRLSDGRRRHAWRSFFFAIDAYVGEPTAGGEVRAVRWFARAELDEVLTAPYHDSFRRWLGEGGRFFSSVWLDRS